MSSIEVECQHIPLSAEVPLKQAVVAEDDSFSSATTMVSPLSPEDPTQYQDSPYPVGFENAGVQMTEEVQNFGSDCSPLSTTDYSPILQEKTATTEDQLLERLAQFESKVEALAVLKPTLYKAIADLDPTEEVSISSSEESEAAAEAPPVEEVGEMGDSCEGANSADEPVSEECATGEAILEEEQT